MKSSVAISTFPEKSAALVFSKTPNAVSCYTYYAFVFSLPFQVVDTGIIDVTYSKMLGYALIILALGQWKLFFKAPPKAFWCFATYLFVYVILGLLAISNGPEDAELRSGVVSHLMTLVQLFVFFWISYNLMRSRRIIRGTLCALTVGCVVLSGLQALGMGSGDTGGGRVSVLGENPNALATMLSLGLLALVGLYYGRKELHKRVRLLCWVGSAALLVAIVRTGSRGNILALVLAFFAFLLRSRITWANVKLGLIVFGSVITLALVSYQIEPIRERWEKTYFERDTAGRDIIFEEAWDMFLEKPMVGWGPVNHLFELGRRLGLPSRDTHNVYLWILNQTGLLGAIPFFLGLWLCCTAAWKARKGSEGSLPMAMLVFLLGVSMKGTYHADKYFWLLLAYILASGNLNFALHTRWSGTRQAIKLRTGPLTLQSPPK